MSNVFSFFLVSILSAAAAAPLNRFFLLPFFLREEQKIVRLGFFRPLRAFV